MLRNVPITPHHEASLSRRVVTELEALAASIREEHPELTVPERYRRFVPTTLDDAPAVCLDDLSSISLMSESDVAFLQERARFRAGDGDVVASCFVPSPAAERYYRDRLRLGAPEWAHPTAPGSSLRVASACWRDRSVRRALVRAVRAEGTAHVHPHMGNTAAWELAVLLRGSSRRRLRVIAPPPGVTAWVNDKLAFARTVQRLFGDGAAPHLEAAGNMAVLARRALDLSVRARFIVIKLAASAGGRGTLVLPSGVFRGRGLTEVRARLDRLISGASGNGEVVRLVGGWETEVIGSPSAQVWIPPGGDGPPLVEGLFMQAFEGRQGVFVGSRRAELPPRLERRIVERCAALARLYQCLGYVGRCSFDLLLVGESIERCRVELIECNGRWGGTSGPMTLMSRIFGDWTSQPYVSRLCHEPGLERCSFADLLREFSAELFDAETRRGRVIFLNSGRLRAGASINVIVLGRSGDDAEETLHAEIRPRLRRLAAAARGDAGGRDRRSPG